MQHVIEPGRNNEIPVSEGLALKQRMQLAIYFSPDLKIIVSEGLALKQRMQLKEEVINIGALRQWENRHIECPFCYERKSIVASRKDKRYRCNSCGKIFTEGVNYVT